MKLLSHLINAGKSIDAIVYEISLMTQLSIVLKSFIQLVQVKEVNIYFVLLVLIQLIIKVIQHGHYFIQLESHLYD
jgi:hypothetical protein